MAEEDKGFKRINFFKGFFTQAEDWQAEQSYHIEKRRIHNKSLHTAGVVEGLQVRETEDGTSISISPGYAIDGEGNDLYLAGQESVPLNLKNYKNAATLYVVVQHREEPIEPRKYTFDSENYAGNAFIREIAELKITEKEPDNDRVELARINLSKDAAKVRDPKDPNNPGPNEINMKFVKTAGAKSPIRIEDFIKVVEEGETRVAPSKDTGPSADDTSVEIETIHGDDPIGFYVSAAYPVGEARISWRMESEYIQGSVVYRMYFKNFSEKGVNVRYKVCKVDLFKKA